MEPPQTTGRFREVFDQAAELAAEARPAFLDRACGDDLKLRAAVESLLAAHDRAGAFLAHPAIPVNLLAALEQLSPGTRIDRYTLVCILGEGGCGTVYLAEQDPPLRRRVAVKVIKPGMDTRQVLARFDLERQVLALLDHPGIAKVFDAGSTATGHPYFVMEWVDGEPITEFCRNKELNIDDRLRLFCLVCSAVQHAHEKGVIHRDLKPGNVLVKLHDGSPMPKVIDFGIAKAIGPDTGAGESAAAPITLARQFLGTPQYMSPEQASAPAGHADCRSDVYSLGAMLYELLADLPPFDPATLRAAALGDLGRVLQKLNPLPPSDRLAAASAHTPTPQNSMRQSDVRKRIELLRGDLDRLVMKALEKNPSRRYQSAADLAADIEKHGKGQSIAAKPSMPARLRQSIHRHRTALRVLCIAAVILLAFAAAAILPRLVPASPPVDPGLIGQFFNGSQFQTPVGSRTDSQIDFDWPAGMRPMPGLRPPHYSIRWRGILVVPPDGVTGIGVDADDGARLYVDGILLFDFARPATDFSQTTLSPGRHALVLEYWNRLGPGTVKLLWTRPASPAEETIPANALFHLRDAAPITHSN